MEKYFDGISCHLEYVVALREAQSVINGKWKLAIVCSMLYEKKRFGEIQRMIGKITPRMLSKELKELELNGVITRTVIPSTPVNVEYELTASGKRFEPLIQGMVAWGIEHRQEVMVG